jgi:hypothetical protein
MDLTLRFDYTYEIKELIVYSINNTTTAPGPTYHVSLEGKKKKPKLINLRDV